MGGKHIFITQNIGFLHVFHSFCIHSQINYNYQCKDEENDTIDVLWLCLMLLDVS